MVFVDGLRLKIIVEFNAPFTLTQVTNFFNNTVKPDLRDELITKLDNNFDAGYSLDSKISISEKSPGHFEIYPKLFFSGNAPSLTLAQLRTGLDTTLGNLKAIMAGHLSANGATNVSYHIHKSIGSVTET